MNKRTKIVCTIGPSSMDYDTLKKMAQAGMDIVRLNFSHGENSDKSLVIKNARKISEELDKPLMIFADFQGPKIRLGDVDGIREIKKGEPITLTLDPSSSPEEIQIQYDLTPFVKKDQRIYLNDGLVALRIISADHKTIKTEALNSGWVSSHKGVNLPDTILDRDVFTEKDRADCEFALKEGVDYIALSFIQRAEDLKPARELIKKHSPRTKIIVKLEKNEGVARLEEIMAATDAIMVARGDLGIEMEPSEVPIVQQKIIRLARQNHKPVIVATHMLESMVENPRATRAEVSDVANAVLDQADAVMLSAETTIGKYPVEAVTTMSSIIQSVEKHPEIKHYFKVEWERVEKDELSFRAITSSAASLAYRVGAHAIAVATASGRTALFLSAFRPDAEIIAITHDEIARNQLVLSWGVTPIIIKPTKTADEFWSQIQESIKEKQLAKTGDRVIVVNGSTVGLTGATDTIKIATL